MSGLDDLTLNRRNIKNAIRRLQNSISDAETDVNVLETSLESISDLFKEYDAVQFKIEKLQLKKKMLTKHSWLKKATKSAVKSKLSIGRL
jgi:hypothetical protein